MVKLTNEEAETKAKYKAKETKWLKGRGYWKFVERQPSLLMAQTSLASLWEQLEMVVLHHQVQVQPLAANPKSWARKCS